MMLLKAVLMAVYGYSEADADDFLWHSKCLGTTPIVYDAIIEKLEDEKKDVQVLQSQPDGADRR